MEVWALLEGLGVTTSHRRSTLVYTWIGREGCGADSTGVGVLL